MGSKKKKEKEGVKFGWGEAWRSGGHLGGVRGGAGEFAQIHYIHV